MFSVFVNIFKPVCNRVVAMKTMKGNPSIIFKIIAKGQRHVVLYMEQSVSAIQTEDIISLTRFRVGKLCLRAQVGGIQRRIGYLYNIWPAAHQANTAVMELKMQLETRIPARGEMPQAVVCLN